MHQQGAEQDHSYAAQHACQHHAQNPLRQLDAPAPVRRRLACSPASRQQAAITVGKTQILAEQEASCPEQDALHVPGSGPPDCDELRARAGCHVAVTRSHGDPSTHGLAHRICRTPAAPCARGRRRKRRGRRRPPPRLLLRSGWRRRPPLRAPWAPAPAPGPPLGSSALPCALPTIVLGAAPPCAARWLVRDPAWCLREGRRRQAAYPELHAPGTEARPRPWEARAGDACTSTPGGQHPPKVKATKYQEHSLVCSEATRLCAITAMSMPASRRGGSQVGAGRSATAPFYSGVPWLISRACCIKAA